MRALLVAFEGWLNQGTPPPDSQVPRLSDGTLSTSDSAELGWPAIPGVTYSGLYNGLTILDRGPDYNPADATGIIAEPPVPVDTRRHYKIMLPRVDADGNEIAGVRSVGIRAPVATHTGWNLRAAAAGAAGHLCILAGSQIPFRATAQERIAAGDPRPSLEERYGNHDGYVAAVQQAANELLGEGFLLPEDAVTLVEQAAASSVLR
jgi:hypothetical protein